MHQRWSKYSIFFCLGFGENWINLTLDFFFSGSGQVLDNGDDHNNDATCFEPFRVLSPHYVLSRVVSAWLLLVPAAGN